MKVKTNLSLFFSFAAIIICLYLLFTRKNAGAETEKEEAGNNDEKYVAPKEEPVEIAHFMTRMQTFHNKLYFSGKNKNLKLSQFYLNELEEEMGAIAEAGIFDVDVNISDNIKMYGLKQVEWMRSQIEKGFDTFESDFDQFTASCNSCHVVSKHDYVKIIKPSAPIYSNQDYASEN